MKIKKVNSFILAVIMCFSVLLTACEEDDSSSSQRLTESITTSSTVNKDENIADGYISLSNKDIENAEIIEETKYYKILYLNSMFYYYIFDESHDVVKSDGPLIKQPRISMVNKHLVKFTLQTGTGLGTQWGYYYDTQTDIISQVFNSIYDQLNDKVAYGGSKKVIIRDIFSNTKYYQEIINFKYPLSEMAEPIKSVKFIDNANKIEVSYFTGTDYQEAKEVFDLT